MSRHCSILRAAAVTALFILALCALPGCRRGGLETMAPPDEVSVDVSAPASDSAGGEPADELDEEPAPPPSSELRTIHQGNLGQTIRIGDLEVKLQGVRNATQFKPNDWSHGLSAKLIVRNVGSKPQAIMIGHNYPALVDTEGHQRPMLAGAGSIKAEGVPKDEQGRYSPEVLSPGGTVTITQAYTVRDDDAGRPMRLSYRVTREALVRIDFTFK